MELKRLTEHIWVMPFEEERDRPNLCYVKGNRLSLAVDAGHSAAHVKALGPYLRDACRTRHDHRE